MQSNEAAKVLGNVAYRPGWSFDAMSYADMSQDYRAMTRLVLGDDIPESLVLFHWTNDTVDTDREYAREGYQQEKFLQDTLPLDAADFDDADELLFVIFNMLMRLELHESREFFRCKDRAWNAPFHPHKDEGNDLWAKCSERAALEETN